MKIILLGTVQNGEKVFDDDSRIEHAYKMSKLEGQKFEMTLEKAVKHRSRNQQGYYHAVIVPHYMDLTGYAHREAKDALELEFAPRYYQDGKPPVIIPEEMWTTVQQEAVNEEIRRYLLEKHGVIVPLPNEVIV